MATNEAAVSNKSCTGDESSESDGETEPAKSFHRCFSTNKNIKSSVCTKEGFLMKQTSSFQRWRRRYFKLKGRTLYYAKDTKVGQDYFTSSVRNIYITKVVPTSNF